MSAIPPPPGRLATLIAAIPRLPSHIGQIARLAVTITLIIVLLRLVDLHALLQLVSSAQAGPLWLAIAIAVADRALMIGKWYPLLRKQVPHVPIGRAARVYLAAGLGNYVLPSSIGSDVLRAVALGRGDKTVVAVGASVLMERLLGMLASAIVALVALALAARQQLPLQYLVPWAAAALGLILVVTVAFLGDWATTWLARRLPLGHRTRWLHLLHRFMAACAMYRHSPRMLAIVAVLSVIEQGFPILIFWVLSRALRIPVDLGMLAVAVPLSLFVGRLPISFAGIGVFEGLLVYLLGLHGISQVDALALGVAGRITELAAQIPGVFVWRDLVRSVRRAPMRLGSVPERASKEPT